MLKSAALIKAAAALVKYAKKYAADLQSEKLAEIVVNHASAAAITGMGAGVLPGLGALIAGGISIGAIWHMYYAIGKYLQLNWGMDMLKAAATAILTNIVHQMWGVLALELAATLIPGFAIPATGFIFFGVTYLSGLTFLLVLGHLFKAGKNLDLVKLDDLMESFRDIKNETNLADELKNVRNDFKEMRKDGSLKKNSEGVDISIDNA